MTPDHELLDIAQAAAFLQVSETSLRRWTKSGRLRCFRVGGRRERRFRRADLLAFLEGAPAPSPSHAPRAHLCGLYTTDRARTRQAAGWLGAALDAGHTCLLAAPSSVRTPVLTHLAPMRPSLRGDIDAGRLVLSEYDDIGSDQMAYWETQFLAARRAGAASIQVVGDVSGGPLSRGHAFKDVLRYEAEYDALSRRFPVTSICLYDARTLSGVETARLLRLHGDVFGRPAGDLVS